MKDTILRIQGQSRHPRSIENVNAEQEDPRKSAPCPQSGILRPSTLSTSLCPRQERALHLSVHANKDWLRSPRLNSKKTSISQPMSVKGPPGFWLWQGGDMRGFDLTWRGRDRRVYGVTCLPQKDRGHWVWHLGNHSLSMELMIQEGNAMLLCWGCLWLLWEDWGSTLRAWHCSPADSNLPGVLPKYLFWCW